MYKYGENVMKNKTLKLFISTVLVMTFALGITACKNNGTSENSTSSGLEMNESVEEGMKIDFSALTLDIYDQVQLKVTGATGAITWNSSNTNIATVTQDGLVIARAAGNAEITASADGETVTCRITVRNEGIVPMLVFVNEQVVIVENTTLAIGASVSFKNQTIDCPISYETADANIATVDANGVVTAISTGETIITVTAVVNDTTTLSDSIQVTVRNIANI